MNSETMSKQILKLETKLKNYSNYSHEALFSRFVKERLNLSLAQYDVEIHKELFYLAARIETQIMSKLRMKNRLEEDKIARAEARRIKKENKLNDQSTE